MSLPQRIEMALLLEKLPKWSPFEGREAIYREFHFNDFQDAFAFMTTCALKAEVIGHHPEWYNCYNVVTVCLNTHDIGGLSELDFELGEFMDNAYNKNAGNN